VLATAKHFAGDGLTTYGTGSNNQHTGKYRIDQGVDEVSHDTFNRLALRQYIPAVQQHRVDERLGEVHATNTRDGSLIQTSSTVGSSR